MNGNTSGLVNLKAVTLAYGQHFFQEGHTHPALLALFFLGSAVVLGTVALGQWKNRDRRRP